MVKPDIQIRAARIEEIPALADFQLAMAEESEGLKLDHATVHRGIELFMRRPEDGTYYAMLVADQLAGCAMIQHEWSDWRGKRVLWVHSVFVAPPYRRTGLFTAFYQFLQKRVEEESELAGIRLYVDHKNQDAQTVYRKLGMTADHYRLYEWLPE